MVKRAHITILIISLSALGGIGREVQLLNRSDFHMVPRSPDGRRITVPKEDYDRSNLILDANAPIVGYGTSDAVYVDFSPEHNDGFNTGVGYQPERVLINGVWVYQCDGVDDRILIDQNAYNHYYESGTYVVDMYLPEGYDHTVYPPAETGNNPPSSYAVYSGHNRECDFSQVDGTYDNAVLLGADTREGVNSMSLFARFGPYSVYINDSHRCSAPYDGRLRYVAAFTYIRESGTNYTARYALNGVFQESHHGYPSGWEEENPDKYMHYYGPKELGRLYVNGAWRGYRSQNYHTVLSMPNVVLGTNDLINWSTSAYNSGGGVLRSLLLRKELRIA